ncbi:MAG: ATP-binding protein [Solirubrobacterales bacterium]
MSRLPIRVRVTLAFTAVMAVVLVAVGLLLYLRLESQLDESLDTGLRSRAGDLAALAGDTDGRLATPGAISVESDESFAQILSPDGRVLDSTEQVSGGPTLGRAELEAASREPQLIDHDSAPGLEARVRLIATPIDFGGRAAVLVVGASLDDRDEALSNLATLLAIGGPVTLLLASLAGYWAAGAALRPVEAMRRRADEISAHSPGERLPVAPAGDELTRLGETLNEMLGRLEAAVARERRFVDDASHELRTPLALHRLELELALRQGSGEDELRTAIRGAIGEADRLIILAEDLLVVARAAEGGIDVQTAPFAVAESFAAVRSRFEERAARAGREIRTSTPPDLRIDADRSRIEQALTNLVDNALRHGDGPVELEARAENGRVELHVTDRGPGFPDEFIERAFERFSRADEARTSDGSGLGLAIVDSIARAHGGSAEARNRDPRGADVSISVRLA